MQRQDSQEPQPSGAPDSHDIGAAPPAYSPKPQAAPEATPTSQTPAPVKDLPSDLNVPQNPLPTTAAASQKQVPGAAPQQAPGVVPLDQLGGQPQWIDCPFCRQRTMTRLNKDGTPMQIVAGVLCCLLCVCLACVPCLAGWFEETTYFCSKCHNKVAMRPDSGPMVVYGPAAQVPSKYAQA